MTFTRIAPVVLVMISLAAVPRVNAEDAIVGEVVDQACFLRQEARGSDHQECAARCLKNGNPAGVLTDEGELFTLAASASGYESFAAKRIRVAGKRLERAIIPETLEVWENDTWVEVPLSKYGTPEKK